MIDSTPLPRLLGLLALCGLLFCSGSPSHAAETGDPFSGLVQAGHSWPETLVAARARYMEWHAQRPLRLGSWHATPPLPAKTFGEVLPPEEQVDLEARDARGDALWRPRPEWVDGQVHQLPGRDYAATYLYRALTVTAPVRVTMSLGSDDGFALWLNGDRLAAEDVPRGVGPGQNRVEVDLVPGEHSLLFKIYNITGGHGFYFDIEEDPLRAFWEALEQAYPLQTAAMNRDAGGARLTWFGERGDNAFERGMLDRVFTDLGASGASLEPRRAALVEAGAPAGAVEWLELYQAACWARHAFGQLAAVDFAALRRAVDDLAETFPEQYTRGAEFVGRLESVQGRVAETLEAVLRGDADALEQGIALSDECRALQREILLSNPLLDFDRMLVVRRGAGQLGLPQNWQGNCSVPRMGYDNEIAILEPFGETPGLTTLFQPQRREFVGDLDLHFDGDRVLFTMPGSHDRWQIWEIGVDGTGLRQVTPGEESDVENYDACYLPDGRVIFGSTRVFQGIPCVGGGDRVANLFLLDTDGQTTRQLCFDQDHNWTPSVLNNGRVLYTRWEYSDTPHYFSRLLFHMNPDGTGQMEYYGSNSFWPNSMFYAKAIPNHPTMVVAIVSGHHGVARMGELVLLDPAVGRREAAGAVQRIPGYGKEVEPVIMDELVNHVWPRFLHPYPLSDKYFVVSCQLTPQSPWAVYLVDIFDNMLELYAMPGHVLFEPIPLRSRPKPPVVPDRVRLDSQDAVIYLTDVYEGPGLKGVPRGEVKSLRVFEFHYTYPQMGGHIHVGIEGPWDVRRILGTVPVHEDGSASFIVPANTPLAVQPLDAEGKALQVMRSWFTAMPGEVLSCVGCHESQNSGPPVRATLAARRPPMAIEPWHGPARGFSFKRDVQPVLDTHCVGCHDGRERANGGPMPDLRAKDENGWGNFTPSYIELHPYVRRPGPESDYHIQVPMEWHADTSELVQMIQMNHHGVHLDDESMDRLVTWIDLNVPDHGTWGEHQPIPGNYHQRRIEMRTRYANRPEDPEEIPDIPRDPAVFVEPRPVEVAAEGPLDSEGWPFGLDQARALQEAAGNPVRRSVDLGDGVTMDFVLIPAGEFVMGAANGPHPMRPRSVARVEKPFWMGVTEVSLQQFKQFDPEHRNGFYNQHHKDHTRPGYDMDEPDYPVIRVSWLRAMEFCDWLSQRTGAAATLPTEAQWEWACRAGSEMPFHYGDVDTDFSAYANLADASLRLMAVSGIDPKPIPNPSKYEDFLPKDDRFNDGAMLLAAVGSYEPNAWGLHDMHGNVSEWTLTDHAPYPYRDDDGRNGLSPDAKKVVRGGSWYDRPRRSTSAFRLGFRPYHPPYNVGFRVIMPAD